jgi:hypothetical protein
MSSTTVGCDNTQLLPNWWGGGLYIAPHGFPTARIVTSGPEDLADCIIFPSFCEGLLYPGAIAPLPGIFLIGVLAFLTLTPICGWQKCLCPLPKEEIDEQAEFHSLKSDSCGFLPPPSEITQ